MSVYASSKDGFISHLTYLVQLPYLGNHRTQKMTNFAISNILFCE